MAVTVRIGPTVTEEYPRGERIAIDDGGHLLVRAHEDGGWQTIAAYPPKSWMSAKVNE